MTERPEGRQPQSQQPEGQDWEAILAAEGMPSDVGPDKGKEVLTKELEKSGEKVATDDVVWQAIVNYWLTRAGSTHGEHKQGMQAISDQLGLKGPDRIDEAQMDQIHEEVKNAQLDIMNMASRISGGGKSMITWKDSAFYRRLNNEAKKLYSHFPREALDRFVRTAISSMQNRQ